MNRTFKAAIAALIIAVSFAGSVAAGPFEDRLNQELVGLSRLEKLYALKIAENKLNEQLTAIATAPETERDGPLWLMMVASFSYSRLTLLLEPLFPEVSAVYRDRTELYADMVRGKLRGSEAETREHENETKKQRVLDQQMSALKKIEPLPTESRLKTLKDLGNRLGLTIAVQGKISSSEKFPRSDNAEIASLPRPSSDCFPNYTKFDVCAKAREIQNEAASMLPMRVNAEMTFYSVVAIRSLVMFSIVWQIDNTDLQAALGGQMTVADLKVKMDRQTKNLVCGDQVAAAFVRLGGKIQYAYRTKDGVPVHAPIVEMCP
jgi:hypothetical protein